MSSPKYTIEIQRETRSCRDCRALTSKVTGTRNGKPICDMCLVTQEPRLGALVAFHASVSHLAEAMRPRRREQRRLFSFVCDQARNASAWFQKSWHAANDREMKLLSRHDLLALRERARKLGGSKAAHAFEDTDWIRRTLRKAMRHGMPSRRFLLSEALKRARHRGKAGRAARRSPSRRPASD